jgi:putative PIN family toxin of toxin-antitoxin system
VRAVLDPNVVVSALLSPNGAPARVVREWLDGGYDLVVSPLLLTELERVLGYPKLRERVSKAEAGELVELLRSGADLRADPGLTPPVRSADPGDDYLIALAAASQAVLVSGDRHLLSLGDDLPVYSPAQFLEAIPGRARDVSAQSVSQSSNAAWTRPPR